MDVGLVNFLLRVTDATSGLTIVDSDDQVYKVLLSRRATTIIAYRAFDILSGELNLF